MANFKSLICSFQISYKDLGVGVTETIEEQDRFNMGFLIVVKIEGLININSIHLIQRLFSFFVRRRRSILISNALILTLTSY